MESDAEFKARMAEQSRRFWLRHAKRCCRSAARCENDSTIAMLLAMAVDGLARSK